MLDSWSNFKVLVDCLLTFCGVDFEKIVLGRATPSIEYEVALERGWVAASFEKRAEAAKDAANDDFQEWQRRKRAEKSAKWEW